MTSYPLESIFDKWTVLCFCSVLHIKFSFSSVHCESILGLFPLEWKIHIKVAADVISGRVTILGAVFFEDPMKTSILFLYALGALTMLT